MTKGSATRMHSTRAVEQTGQLDQTAAVTSRLLTRRT